MALMLKLSGIGKRRLLKSFFRKLNAPYQLKILDVDNEDEILNLDLTKKSAYLLISSFLVGSFLLLSFLFLFTPIKYYIPGFETNESRKKILSLNAKVDSLGALYSSREAYLTNLIMVAKGNEQYLTDTTALDANEIFNAEVVNSGAIDNASKYKHLLGIMPKKRSNDSLDKTQSKEELPPKDSVKVKVEEEKPKKKYKDTIIIRK